MRQIIIIYVAVAVVDVSSGLSMNANRNNQSMEPMVTCEESFNHYIQRDKKENHELVTKGM